MKTLRLKTMIIAGMAGIISVGIFSGSAQCQSSASDMNLPVIKHDKAAINRDIASIAAQQTKLNTIKNSNWEAIDNGADNSSCSIDLIKAKAELRKDRAYLKADKLALLNEHNALIEQRHLVVLNQQAQLNSLHRKLNSELDKGNPGAAKVAQDIINCKQALQQSNAALNQAKLARDADLMAINKTEKEYNTPATVASTKKSKVNNQAVAMK